MYFSNCTTLCCQQIQLRTFGKLWLIKKTTKQQKKNHRIAYLGRHLWRWPTLTSLLKEESTTAGCSGLCQGSFELLQVWRLHKLSEKPAPMFDHPHSIKVASYVQVELLYFNLRSLPLALSVGAPEKSLGSSVVQTVHLLNLAETFCECQAKIRILAQTDLV